VLEKDLIHRMLLVGLLFCASASAEVIIDQIGPMDGSGIGVLNAANQYFESEYVSFDIGVIENVSIQEQSTLAAVEIVISGWDGFSDPTSITSYEANVYSNPSAASLSLLGNVATAEIDVADATVVSDWYGSGFLISIPFQVQIDEGSYWFGVIPANNFSNFGQTGVAESLLGDGILSMQANPGEGFGFGTLRELSYESAFRLHNDIFVDPCTVELPEYCAEDIDGDGFAFTVAGKVFNVAAPHFTVRRCDIKAVGGFKNGRK